MPPKRSCSYGDFQPGWTTKSASRIPRDTISKCCHHTEMIEKVCLGMRVTQTPTSASFPIQAPRSACSERRCTLMSLRWHDSILLYHAHDNIGHMIKVFSNKTSPLACVSSFRTHHLVWKNIAKLLDCYWCIRTSGCSSGSECQTLNYSAMRNERRG